MDRTQSGITTPGQSGPGNDGNKGILCIPQGSSITGASPLDCFVLYPRHSLGEFYPFVEMQSVYSAVPADWTLNGFSYCCLVLTILFIKYCYAIQIICTQFDGFK